MLFQNDMKRVRQGLHSVFIKRILVLSYRVLLG